MRGSKVDNTQAEIVAEFKRQGCAVKIMSAAGDGFPDLMVWCCGNRLVEVKSPGGSLTPAQEKFIDAWPGPVDICRNRIEAIALVQKWRGGSW